MASRADRNRLYSYTTIVAFLIFSLIQIHQLSEHFSASGDGTGDTPSRIWPFENRETSIVGTPISDQESLRTSDGSTHDDTKLGSKTSLATPERQPSFYEIAIQKGTDKVTVHNYQDIYERYLPRERNGKVKILEIGLGCETKDQTGASYDTWIEYFPNADLYFIESDEPCANHRRENMSRATIVTGDVAETLFVEEFQAGYGTNFDVIVSSTGLTIEQQVASLETLWKTVSPGGVFFCEFLETSYLDKYGARRVASNNKGTVVQYLQKMIEDLMYPDPNLEAYHLKGMGISYPRKVQFDEVESIKHIDCERQICAVLKRAD